MLDVGCRDGAGSARWVTGCARAWGVDAGLVGPLAGPRHRLLPGSFPDDLPPGAGGFDAVTLAEDFEHIPASPGWRR